MNRDGTGQHRLTRSRGLDGFPEWSPDGRKIAFESNRAGGFDLYVMNANGSRVRRVAASPAFDGIPSWSPDGHMLSFESDRSGNTEVYVMPAAGGPARRVTHHPGFDGSAVWLNRRRLAFASRRADANVDIYSVGVDGRGLKRLTRNILDDTAPARSPDGSRIAFVRGLTVSTDERRRLAGEAARHHPSGRRGACLVTRRQADRIPERPRRKPRGLRHERERVEPAPADAEPSAGRPTRLAAASGLGASSARPASKRSSSSSGIE